MEYGFNGVINTYTVRVRCSHADSAAVAMSLCVLITTIVAVAAAAVNTLASVHFIA